MAGQGPTSDTPSAFGDEDYSSGGTAVRIASVAALGGLLFGYDSAVINGAVASIRSHFDINDASLGFAVASALLGAAVGAMTAGRLADRLGRIAVMKIAAVLFFISAIGTGLATSVWMIVLFRIVGGLGVGVASVIAPAYIAETSPPRIRGRLGSLQQLAIVSGIFLSLAIDYVLAQLAGGAAKELWLGMEAWRRIAVSMVVNSASMTMPRTRMTTMIAIAAGMSVMFCAFSRRTPIDAVLLTITTSSPDIRLRQAKAQPCLRPATNMGNDAGRIRCRYRAMPRSPMLLADRSSSGGMWSAPAMTPVAMAGAVPITMTNRIADVVIPKKMIANGNQAIAGIVCSPVMIGPKAARSRRFRDTATPTAVPISRASPKPTTARPIVVLTACHSTGCWAWLHSSAATVAGLGRMNDGFQPLT